MANTRATIRTRALRYEFGILYAALAFFALLNMFFTLTPVADSNAVIDSRMQQSLSLSPSSRPALYSRLLDQQDKNLARRPSEPYGWARLAWLRLATPDNQKPAFEALNMSDQVSPYEAPQLPERAVMWYRLKAFENPDQQAYQDVLWQKAYSMERDATWSVAVQNKLDAVVGQSLHKTSPELYEEWKALEAAKK